jgi:glycosyltransferase involved in cell wall biosynthesis
MKSLKLKPDIQFELVVMTHDIHYQEVLELGIVIHSFIRKRKKDLTVFNSFYKLCKDYKPDIVHCWDTMTAVYITPICKMLHLKLINGMIVDAPQKKSILSKPWMRGRLTFPFANAIIGNSRAGLLAYNAPAKKSYTIYNGFNFDRLGNLTPKDKIRELLNIKTEFVIGMVATFSEFKDYPTYFNAATLLLEKRTDVTFLAIGKDTDSTEIRNLINEKYLRHFRLLGKKTDIESFINVLDIGVLSTFTEGISNSILEYMALSKPVIATDGGGTCEILVDQETGFLVRRSDPVGFAEKMEVLLNDQPLREAMGNRGRERIKNVFSIDKMVSEYISIYETLVSQ